MAAASRGDVSGRSGGEVDCNGGDGVVNVGSGGGGGGREGRARGGGGASTRLEFGVGLGAAAAAVVLGGTTAAAIAEDVNTAVAAAPAAVAAAADGAAQETAAATSAAAAPEVAAAAPAESPLRDLGFEVPYTGKSLPLSKFLGSRATLVVNPKIDDPESLHQVQQSWSCVCPHLRILFLVCRVRLLCLCVVLTCCFHPRGHRDIRSVHVVAPTFIIRHVCSTWRVEAVRGQQRQAF